MKHFAGMNGYADDARLKKKASMCGGALSASKVMSPSTCYRTS